MKRSQRLAMDHRRDGDIVGATDAIKMVLNIAGDEADLVEIAQMINDLQFCRGVSSAAAPAREADKVAPKAAIAPDRISRRCIKSLQLKIMWLTNQSSAVYPLL